MNSKPNICGLVNVMHMRNAWLWTIGKIRNIMSMSRHKHDIPIVQCILTKSRKIKMASSIIRFINNKTINHRTKIMSWNWKSLKNYFRVELWVTKANFLHVCCKKINNEQRKQGVVDSREHTCIQIERYPGQKSKTGTRNPGSGFTLRMRSSSVMVSKRA